MLLALDIGNSSISIGIFDISETESPQMFASFKISVKSYSSDEYLLLIKDFIERSFHSEIPVIDCSVISSVVPELTDILAESARKLCSSNPLIIDQGIRTGFGIRIKNPEQLGSDIVCNTAAALHIAETPLVILDMGTATTITFVDGGANVNGTIIIPGLKVSMTALTDSAALLSSASLEYNEELIGRDTQSAIRSGVINGNVYMIDGFIRNIREKMLDKNEKLNLIATGGLAERIIPHTRNKFRYCENLTLLGLAYLYIKNRKANN